MQNPKTRFIDQNCKISSSNCTLQVITIVVVALGYPSNLRRDDVGIVLDPTDGQQYYLVPVQAIQQESTLIRNKRQSKQISCTSIDNIGFELSHSGTIIDNKGHCVEVTGTLGSDWGEPLTTSGTVDYTHKLTNSGASVTATHTPGLGTDVGAEAKYNFFNSRDGRTTGSVSGNYDQHFGGAMGTGRPNYGAFITLTHNF